MSARETRYQFILGAPNNQLTPVSCKTTLDSGSRLRFKPSPFLAAIMRTSTADSRLIASLRRRIKQFYERLNRREFEKCFEMLDPQVRGSPTAITLYQFSSSLERFLEWCPRC